MAYKPSAKRRRKPERQELNVTPIMNIFMIIVPFLLLTVSFAKIAIIDMNLPQDIKSEPDNSSQETPPEVLTIEVTKKGFELGGIGEGLVISRIKEHLNYKQLTNELVKLKDKHSDSNEVIILFEPDIPYETVINVMDASREATGETRRELYPLVSVGEVETAY